MTARLYLESTGSTAISPAVHSSIDETASTFARTPMGTAQAGSALTDTGFCSALTTASQESVIHQCVSTTLDVNQTITGTASFVLRGRENSGTNNAHIGLALRVVKPDGTDRGTLLYYSSSGSEWGTGFRTRIISAAGLSSVNALAGDYIVADILALQFSPTAGPRLDYTFGAPNDGTADFALTSNLTTNLVPWIEFSQTLTFGTPAGGSTQPPRSMHQFRQRRSA